mmetsp:Transcript_127/g.202  ORF Transcript_127/g.202 Transcript_127/m.202 type:complete len:224 (-) Transcript_127:157-828(-)
MYIILRIPLLHMQISTRSCKAGFSLSSNIPVVNTADVDLRSDDLITRECQILRDLLVILLRHTLLRSQQFQRLIISVFQHNIRPQPQINNPLRTIHLRLRIYRIRQIVPRRHAALPRLLLLFQIPHDLDRFFDFGKLLFVGRALGCELLFVGFEFGEEVAVGSDEEFGRGGGVEGGGEEFDVVEEFGGGDASFVFSFGYGIEAYVGEGFFCSSLAIVTGFGGG